MKQCTFSCLCLVLGVAGCGGGETASDDTEQSTTSGSERPRPVEDNLAVSGLMGTIRQDQVENALNPRMGRFQRCFEQRMRAVELLGGSIRLAFRIHLDGSVAWVYPTETDVGDRDTERCILDVARSTRFPQPRGGEAEFHWGFGLDPDEGLRPPLSWGDDSLRTAAEEVRALGRRCNARGPGHTITAYIEPGGAVLAAGGTMPDENGEDALECILEAVRAIAMPDPGSYPAKITFTVR